MKQLLIYLLDGLNVLTLSARLPVRQPQSNRHAFDAGLPRASSSVPPASCRRLSIFGSANIVDNLSESDLESVLGVPVRLIPTSNCRTLREKIRLIDPALDRFVLMHGLCDEARDIATQPSKSDLLKGADSDQVKTQVHQSVLY